MKHIDKLFKEKLYHHEAQVPEGMWERIAPIAEEESGRAILWFWFAGILTLLLGGYGMYQLLESNSTPTDTKPLVHEIKSNYQAEEQLVDNSLTTELNTLKEKNNLAEDNASIAVVDKASKTETSALTTSKKQEAVEDFKLNHVQSTKQPTQNRSKPRISNTVESISNAVGVPANLVITKSYINKDGSIIKQTNLTDELNNDGPTYDVILNLEAKELNAGALLRIIEPIENIPLPALQKELKKKTTDKSIL